MKKNDALHIMVLSIRDVFLIGQLILEVTFPFDWDLCGEYRQPNAQVGEA